MYTSLANAILVAKLQQHFFKAQSVERATSGEKVLSSIPAVATPSLVVGSVSMVSRETWLESGQGQRCELWSYFCLLKPVHQHNCKMELFHIMFKDVMKR